MSEPSKWHQYVGLALAGIGGALVGSYGQSGRVNIVPANITYPDLAATLLAAVGVIVAIFGGVLALAAIWGFDRMKDEAIRSATEAALAELREQIENGPLRAYMLGEIERLILDEVNSARMDRRIQERVDRIVLGNPEDELLDQEFDGDEQ